MNKIAKRMNKIAKDFKWNEDSLWKLRQQISLGSMYYSDYRNNMGVDEHDCCDFFDSFLEDSYDLALYYKYGDNYYKLEDADISWDEVYDKCDNSDWLWNYYCNYEWEPLPVKDDEEEDY